MKNLKLIVLFFFASFMQSYATIYYVSENGKNTNEGDKPETAFATLQYAHDQTQPGDIVYIMDGTYYPDAYGNLLTITTGGVKDKPITYKAYSGHKPKLIARKSHKCWSAIRIEASYIIIDGLELMGDNDNITLAEGEARHDHFLDTQNGGRNWSYLSQTNTNDIYIIGDKETHRGPVHVTIKNCQVYKFPGGGISSEIADYVTIENNIVHSNAWYMIYAGSGISVFHPWNSDENASNYRNIVRNNRVYNNETRVKWADRYKYSDGNGIIIDDHKNKQIKTSSDTDSGKLYRLNYKGKTLVVNNISYGNGGCGINVFSSKNVDVVQNTVYDNGASPHLEWPDLEINATENVKVYNNIAYATRGKAFGAYNNVNHENDYNLYYNGTSAAGGPNNIVDQDPQFADRGNANFQLLAGSPAIDNGTHTLARYIDFEGTTRPQGNGMDIGAYEYQGTTTPTPPGSGNEIYADALGNGWTDSYSWNSTRNLAKDSPVKTGSKSLSVNYTSFYGGLGLRNETAVDVSNLNAIKFWVYSASARNMTLQTQSEDGSGTGLSTVVTFTTNAGTWKEITITSDQLGNPALIKRINFVGSNFTGEVIIDEIRFEPNPLPAVTESIYADALAGDWTDSYSWGSTRDFSNTSPVYGGNNSLKVNFTSNYGGLGLGKASAMATDDLVSIKLWVYSTTARTLTLQTQSEDGSGAGLSNPVSFITDANTWKEVTVTREALGNPSLIKRINITSQNFTGEVIFDWIRMISQPSGSLRSSEVVNSILDAEDLSVKNSFQVYPNPNNGKRVSVKIENPEQVNITLYNASGSLMPFRKTKVSDNLIEIEPRNDLKSGLYIMHVQMQHQTVTKKILIRR